MKNYRYHIVFVFAILFFVTCQSKTVKETQENTNEVESIEITEKQYASAKMVLGSPQLHKFSETVNTMGFIKPSPAGKAQVSVFLPGKVQNIRFAEGEYVEKGSTLFNLEGIEIIELQQEFAQNDAELDLAKYELDRLEKLTKENITAKKELKAAQSKFQILNAKHESYKAKLKLLNINPIAVSEGKIHSSIPIVSPINGYITMQNLVEGEYLEPQKSAVEIVNTQKLQLYLTVFEKDIVTLEKGQKVIFNSAEAKDQYFDATLSFVGKSIHPESKTIQCIAEINTDISHRFVSGMYVECSVVTCERESLSIPTDAILKDGYNHYVLVKTREDEGTMFFTKKLIETGREELEFTEVLTVDLTNILLKGVYNLNAEE